MSGELNVGEKNCNGCHGLFGSIL